MKNEAWSCLQWRITVEEVVREFNGEVVLRGWLKRFKHFLKVEELKVILDWDFSNNSPTKIKKKSDLIKRARTHMEIWQTEKRCNYTESYPARRHNRTQRKGLWLKVIVNVVVWRCVWAVIMQGETAGFLPDVNVPNLPSNYRSAGFIATLI